MAATTVETTTRPNLVLCTGRRSGIEPLIECLAAHPDIGFVETQDFDDVDGDAETFPLNTFAPTFTRGEGCEDAFEAMARRHVGRRIIAWRPGYALEWPHVLVRILESLPEAKLLFCLRDPVEATLHRFLSARDEMPPTLDEALDAAVDHMAEVGRFENRGQWPEYLQAAPEISMLIQGGAYAVAVRRYLELFDRTRLHFVPYESALREPEATLAAVAAFLDVDAEPLLAGAETLAATPVSAGAMDAATRVRLDECYATWNARLFALLGWPANTWPEGQDACPPSAV